ncbi:hypothetical protein [Clostridium algoriphilum]|nr:hypothetical protein [Clostridium algoriphilum]
MKQEKMNDNWKQVIYKKKRSYITNITSKEAENKNYQLKYLLK